MCIHIPASTSLYININYCNIKLHRGRHRGFAATVIIYTVSVSVLFCPLLLVVVGVGVNVAPNQTQ